MARSFDVELSGLAHATQWIVRVNGAPDANAAMKRAAEARGGHAVRAVAAGSGPAPMDQIEFSNPLMNAKPVRQGMLRRLWRPAVVGERTLTDADVRAIRGAVTRGVLCAWLLAQLILLPVVAVVLIVVFAEPQ